MPIVKAACSACLVHGVFVAAHLQYELDDEDESQLMEVQLLQISKQIGKKTVEEQDAPQIAPQSASLLEQNSDGWSHICNAYVPWSSPIPGRQGLGHDPNHLGEAGCRRACDNTPNCNFVTYHRVEGNCWMEHMPYRPTQSQCDSNHGGRSYFRGPSQQYPPEIGGVHCPKGQLVCFGIRAFMGGSDQNPICYNPGTHQCLRYGYPDYTQTVCALDEEVCGGECYAAGTGYCCGATDNNNPIWLASGANRQCCTGRCTHGCEHWDCDASMEECIHEEDHDWSAHNPRACRFR